MKKVVPIFCLVVAGCASKAENIVPAYVSPMLYDQYSCPQLSQEAQRLSAHASEVSGIQDANATHDAITTGVAIVILWPVAFLNKGDGATAAELSRLKGEMEAVEQASIQKKCGITFKKDEAKRT